MKFLTLLQITIQLNRIPGENTLEISGKWGMHDAIILLGSGFWKNPSQ